MTELEYTKRQLALTANVLNQLITIFGSALPHCRSEMVNLINAWDDANNSLDAQKKPRGSQHYETQTCPEAGGAPTAATTCSQGSVQTLPVSALPNRPGVERHSDLAAW